MNSINEQFNQIYNEYIDKIYRYVYLKVNSQEIAEDITSQVFIKVWEALKDSNSTITNPSAFLYQIAKNTVIDYYRKKDKIKVLSMNVGPEIIDPGTNSYANAVLNTDIDVIKKSLQKLDKEYQDIIIWHYLEDMAIADIAKLLGRPTGTVRVMLHRGLKDLKQIIREG